MLVGGKKNSIGSQFYLVSRSDGFILVGRQEEIFYFLSWHIILLTDISEGRTEEIGDVWVDRSKRSSKDK